METLRRGDAPGCSFMFSLIQDEWRGAGKQREHELVEVELHEISCGVTFPAYVEATARCGAMTWPNKHRRRPGRRRKEGHYEQVGKGADAFGALHEIGFDAVKNEQDARNSMT